MSQPSSPDIPGQALADWYFARDAEQLWVHDTLGPEEEMPVAWYFRTEAEMPELERIALEACRGRVLDIGAGAGSHALVLQQRGFDVTALELSPAASDVMRHRGLQQVVTADVFTWQEQRFDTLLLLMNGLGLAGSLDGLARLLRQLKALLLPGGQIIADSSDLAYLYDDETPRPTDRYYGMVTCRYEYKEQYTPWFDWLYVDVHTLTELAREAGLSVTLLYEDGDNQYLARLAEL